MTPPLLIRRLEEALSQRSFWDFYAVYTNGLDDVDGVDVDHIVDVAWKEVFEGYARAIHDRLVKPALIKATRRMVGKINDDDPKFSVDRYRLSASPHFYDENGDGFDIPKVMAFLYPSDRKFFMPRNFKGVMAAIKWYVNNPLFGADGEVGEVEFYTSAKGVWDDLARKIVGEERMITASRKAKAMSVDRMLAWSHHNEGMAVHIGPWAETALNLRAHGNMNTILARCSPGVRDALKSATHGIGQPEMTQADVVQMYLNRNERITRVQREGNTFRVRKEPVHSGRGAAILEFTVFDDGVEDLTGEFHPFEQERFDGSKFNRSIGTIIHQLPAHTPNAVDPDLSWVKEWLSESLDTPYRARCNFKTEEVEDDEAEEEGAMKTVLQPVQMVTFTSDDGTKYLWYARQSRYDPTVWEIAFGTHLGVDIGGAELLDINLTGKHDALRVLSTVLTIINAFVEFDEDSYEIQHLTFSSKGDKRTKLYLSRIIPKIEHFALENVNDKGGGESEIALRRTS